MSSFPSLSMPASHSELGSIYFKGINQIFSRDTRLFNFANDKGQFLHLLLHDYHTEMYSLTTMQRKERKRLAIMLDQL